jgi:hypothetical protein
VRCYDAWVRARPVGIGACCAACDDRRRAHLRHYEMGLRTNAPGGRWVVMCHNCCAVADTLEPPPRSVEGLKMRLHRDRRWGDRRAESVGRGVVGRAPWLERRDGDRRESDRSAVDATDLAMIIEMEADFEIPIDVDEASLADIGEVTGVHWKLPTET